ncbi:MAG: hypothetical protein KBD19_03615 [Candidatus Moranbacteria bacterium]|nr:hypothetical protein [Candidatus Moranbacteria bacterium]
MEKMSIKIDSGTIVVTSVPLPTTAAVPSDEYLAQRKAAGTLLPVIDVPVPDEDDQPGHKET